jgi:hypothetical protein
VALTVFSPLATPIITALENTSYGKMIEMPKKRKKKRFRAVEAVKAMARERIGTPQPSRVVPDGRKAKTEKHKPTMGEILSDL